MRPGENPGLQPASPTVIGGLSGTHRSAIEARFRPGAPPASRTLCATDLNPVYHSIEHAEFVSLGPFDGTLTRALSPT